MSHGNCGAKISQRTRDRADPIPGLASRRRAQLSWRGYREAGAWGLAGPGKRKAGLGHWVGLVEFGFGLGFVSSFSILFLSSFLFLIQTKFEFKYKFEFKPHSNN